MAGPGFDGGSRSPVPLAGFVGDPPGIPALKTRIVPVGDKAQSAQPATRLPEVASPLPGPPLGPCSAQVILYTAKYPTYFMGNGVVGPDGSLEVHVPIAAPPAGTPIQVILCWMGGQKFIEGATTAPNADGSFGISTAPGIGMSTGVSGREVHLAPGTPPDGCPQGGSSAVDAQAREGIAATDQGVESVPVKMG
jgi:hypothetical protein